MRTQKPNPIRSLQPIIFGMVPLVGIMLWTKLMEVLYAFAHQPSPTLSVPVFYGVIGASLIGFIWSAHFIWADFVRGDYYVDLVTYRDR